jgi:hypothetical protein
MALDEVYLLLIACLSLIFGVPPLRWIYRTYIKQIMEVAGEKVTEYKKQMSERISDAGKKLGHKMRV